MNKLRRNLLAMIPNDRKNETFKACKHCYVSLFDFCDRLGCPCYPIIRRLEKIADGKASPRFVAQLILKYGSDKAVEEIFDEMLVFASR